MLVTDNQSAYFLATTAIEEFWDTTKPILFLGDWCRRYSRKSFWEPLAGEVLGSPWEDTQRFHQANHYVVDVYERLLPVLAEALNELHDVKHGMRYWRIILGPWLQLYIPGIYDRYMCLQMAFDKHPNVTSTVLSEDAWVTPCDTLEFVQLLKGDAYNLQIYSRMLKLLGKNFPQKSIPVGAPPFIFRENIKKQRILRLTNFALRCIAKIRNLFKAGHPIIFRNSYFSHIVELQIIAKTFGTVWPILGEADQISHMETDGTIRCRLDNLLPAKNDFEILMNKLLPIDIPQSFIEGFNAIEHASQHHYPDKPKAIFSAVAWYYDEPFKQWAAASAERGALLLGMQHGGYYGSLRFFPNEDHELAITDRYFSWGWERPTFTQKVFPGSAAKLSGRKLLTADNRKQGILFVANSWPRYLMQLYYPPTQFNDYLLWQSRFAKTMPQELLSKMRIRFHREDFGWDIIQRWMDFCPVAAVEKWDMTFLQSLDTCLLYVCDHQGTTFLEALSADKPSILFWNPAIVEPRPEAQPYYDRLREVGILYDSPEAAANAVAAVYDDVERWWNETDRQAARQSFCNQFARTSPNAVKEWANEFNLIAKGDIRPSSISCS